MDSRKLVISAAAAVVIIGGLLILIVYGLGVGNQGPTPLGDVRETLLEGRPAPISDATSEAVLAKKDGGPGNANTPGSEPVTAVEEIVDTRPISIEGKVSTGDDQAVAGARVVALEGSAWQGALEQNRDSLQANPFVGLRRFQDSLISLAASMPSTETREDGAYAVRGLAEGDYRVLVSRDGFLPHEEESWVTVEAGKTARYDVDLVPGHDITGKVVDGEGKPVQNALVTAKASEIARLRGIGKLVQTLVDQSGGKLLLQRGQGATNGEGLFRIPSLEPTLYDLRIHKDGFAWSDLLKVPAGTRDVMVRLVPATRVVGRVLDPERKPVSGAEVTLSEPQLNMRKLNNPLAMASMEIDILGEKTRRVTTADDGVFAMDMFVDALYELVVQTEDYPPFRDEVEVERGTVNLDDVVLKKPQAIKGRIVGPGGAPIEGARVRASPSNEEDALTDRRNFEVMAASGKLFESETDSSGVFSLTNLASDTYDLLAEADGFVAAIQQGVDAPSSRVTMMLQTGITLRGLLLDAEDEIPIAGAEIRERNRRESAAVTDDEGRFEIRGVEGKAGSGTSISVSHPEYGTSWERVRLPRDGAEPAIVRLRRAKGLEGIVFDDAGQPLAGARVKIEVPGFPPAMVSMMANRETETVLTNSEGAFFLTVPRMGGGMGFEVVASYPGFAKARHGPLTANRRQEQSWPLIEMRLSRGSAIEGRIFDADGQSIAGARVRAQRNVQLSGEAMMVALLIPQTYGDVAYSGTDGRFRLAGIEPGAYRLEVRALGYAKKLVQPVDVSEAPTPLDVVLDAGGKITGRVVDLDGHTLEGIEVVAFLNLEASGEPPLEGDTGAPTPNRREEEMMRLAGLGTANTKTTDDGTFALTHLPDGEFRVVARGRRYEPTILEGVQAGDQIPDLLMAPYCSILGRVVDAATGLPLPRYTIWLQEKVGGKADEYRQEWRLRREVESDEGLFEYSNVGAGEYRLRVAAKDYVPTLKPVLLDPGAEAEVEIVANPGFRVEGIVRSAGSSEAITGATVRLHSPTHPQDYEWQYNQGRRSNADGHFELSGLKDGDYQVSVSHADYYLDEKAVLKFTIPPAEPMTLDIVMHPAGQLKGKIHNLPPVDRRAGGYHLTLTPIETESAGVQQSAGSPAQPRPAHSTWVNEQGSYVAASLRPGRYRVAIVRQVWRREEGTTPQEQPQPQTLGEVDIEVGKTMAFDATVP